jgi:hypothetical protein
LQIASILCYDWISTGPFQIKLFEETDVALRLFFTFYFDNGPFTFLEPGFADDGFLVHTDLIAGKNFPAIISDNS